MLCKKGTPTIARAKKIARAMINIKLLELLTKAVKCNKITPFIAGKVRNLYNENMGLTG